MNENLSQAALIAKLRTELNILSDILTKKTGELEIILAISENQETLIQQSTGSDFIPSDPNLQSERTIFFKAMSDEKQKHIDEVLRCDSVFQTLFDSIKESVEANSRALRESLLLLQQQIEVVLELDVKIRAQEAKNRSFLQQFLPTAKKDPAPSNVARQRLLSQYRRHTK